MLGGSNVHATIAVREIARSQAFYEGVLGLELLNADPYEVLYKSGDSQLAVYVSKYAGTNQATSATWEVDDLEGIVEGLKASGVTFEHYDNLGDSITRDGDIHFMGDQEAAWFKDPDGNILSIHHS